MKRTYLLAASLLIFAVIQMAVYLVFFDGNHRISTANTLVVYDQFSYQVLKDLPLNKLNNLEQTIVIRKSDTLDIMRRANYDAAGRTGPGPGWLGTVRLGDGVQKRLFIKSDGTLFQIIGEKGVYHIRSYDMAEWRQAISGKGL